RKILLIFGCWPLDRPTRRWYVKVLIAINLVTLVICMLPRDGGDALIFGVFFYIYKSDLMLVVKSHSSTIDMISLKASTSEAGRINRDQQTKFLTEPILLAGISAPLCKLSVAYCLPWYRFDRNTWHLIQMMTVRTKLGCNTNVPVFKTSRFSFLL
uniref:Uncharacterized protein n=1 Tax=Anopheles christyi TaxID=43041 RepID=A0A182K8P4_9DIPT